MKKLIFIVLLVLWVCSCAWFLSSINLTLINLSIGEYVRDSFLSYLVYVIIISSFTLVLNLKGRWFISTVLSLLISSGFINVSLSISRKIVSDYFIDRYVELLIVSSIMCILCIYCFVIEFYQSRRELKVINYNSIIQIIPFAQVAVLQLLCLEQVSNLSGSDVIKIIILPEVYLFFLGGLSLYGAFNFLYLKRDFSHSFPLSYDHFFGKYSLFTIYLSIVSRFFVLIFFAFNILVRKDIALGTKIIFIITYLIFIFSFKYHPRSVLFIKWLVGKVFCLLSLLFVSYLYFEDYLRGYIEITNSHYRILGALFLILIMTIGLFEIWGDRKRFLRERNKLSTFR